MSPTDEVLGTLVLKCPRCGGKAEYAVTLTRDRSDEPEIVVIPGGQYATPLEAEVLGRKPKE